MTTRTTERSSTDYSSPRGRSSPIVRRRLSSSDVVVQTAVDLISTSSRTPARLDTTEAKCRLPGAPSFIGDRHSENSMRQQRNWCVGCPIAAECLVDALLWENKEPAMRVHFVRGGLNRWQRRALIERLRDEGVLHENTSGKFS